MRSLSDYFFGKHVLEFGSHLAPSIFSHSACVFAFVVCANAGAVTAAAILRARTVRMDFMGVFLWLLAPRLNAV